MKIAKLFAMAMLTLSLSAFVSCGGDDEIKTDDNEQTGGGDENKDPEGPSTSTATFKIKASDVEAMSAVLAVEASDQSAYYYVSYIEKEYADEYGSLAELIQEDLDYYAEYVGTEDEYYGTVYTWDDFLYTGTNEYDLYCELFADTEYVAYVAGVVNGKVATDVDSATFTTAPAGTSSNTFEFTVEGSSVTVTPSNDDFYMWNLYDADYFEGMSDDEIIEDELYYCLESVYYYGYFMSDFLYTGEDTYDFGDDEYGLTEGTEYMVYAFGYNGAPTTALAKHFFTYGEDEGDDDNNGDDSGKFTYTETFSADKGVSKLDYATEESVTSTVTGVTWTVTNGVFCQKTDNASFDNEWCITMGGGGKIDVEGGVITTGVLKDGISKLKFGYLANKNKVLTVDVLVGDKVVWTSGALELNYNGGTQVIEYYTFDITGAEADAVLRFTNTSAARRISIGNIEWNSATAKSAAKLSRKSVRHAAHHAAGTAKPRKAVAAKR